MAKYRVLTTSFIGNTLVAEDTVIEYDGIPHDNLEPLDAPAQEAAEQTAQADMESIARQKAAAAGASPDDVDTSAATSAAAKAAEEAMAASPSGAAAGLV